MSYFEIKTGNFLGIFFKGTQRGRKEKGDDRRDEQKAGKHGNGSKKEPQEYGRRKHNGKHDPRRRAHL